MVRVYSISNEQLSSVEDIVSFSSKSYQTVCKAMNKLYLAAQQMAILLAFCAFETFETMVHCVRVIYCTTPTAKYQ